MTASRYDAICMGNALVDVFGKADDETLSGLGIPRGGMRLLSEVQAARYRRHLQTHLIAAGGGAANVAAGMVSLGGQAHFVGKIGNDDLGASFRAALLENGVEFSTMPLITPPTTGYCLVLSSDDGERSMGTYLGAAGHLNVHDLDPEEISSARSLYIEGYLFDSILGGVAVRAAIEIARASEKRVTLSLADPQCVVRNRQLFRNLLESRSVDVVFGNLAEFLALYPTIDAVRDVCARKGLWAAITISEKGSIVCTAVESVQVPARSPVSVVDTTGAGDLYAAGFLLGLARELQPVACATLGSFAAARIIEQHGARPTESLKAEAVRLGLLPSMPAK